MVAVMSNVARGSDAKTVVCNMRITVQVLIAVVDMPLLKIFPASGRGTAIESGVRV